MKWYLDVLQTKYAQFSGRAQRKEYWMFFLYSFLALIALAIVDSIIGTTAADDGPGLFGGLFCLGVVVPFVAVGIRRLHDTDRSGLWLLLALTGIGSIVPLIFMCLDGTPGENRFGPSPKAAAPEPNLAGT